MSRAPYRLHERHLTDAGGAPAFSPAFLAVLDGPLGALPSPALASAQLRLARERPELSDVVERCVLGKVSLAAVGRELRITRQSVHERKARGLALLRSWCATPEAAEAAPTPPEA